MLDRRPMQIRRFPGAWYADCLPSGAYVVLVRDSHLDTDKGRVELPRSGDNPLFVRLSPDGLQFAGQSHLTDEAIYYDGMWHNTGRVAVGVSPVIYDNYNRLLVSNGAVGSQGYRYVRVDNTVVSGDDTYAPGPLAPSLYEWTDLSDHDTLVIGQGPESGCWLWDGAHHRLVCEGQSRFIRAHRTGDVVAIAVWNIGTETVLIWATVEELQGLPIATQPLPDPVRPAVSSVPFAGTFTPAADTPGNLAVWNGAGTLPAGRAIVATADAAERVPRERLMGIWVDAVEHDVTAARALAVQLQVPLVVYKDDRFYPLNLVAGWCGETPWIAALQCYVDCRGREGESLGTFTAEVSNQIAILHAANRRWMAMVRTTTGGWTDPGQTIPTIPLAKVTAALNLLAPMMTGCEGWLLFNWQRGDGITHYPELRPFGLTWLEVPTTVSTADVRPWTATFYPEVSVPEMKIPDRVYATIQQFANANPLPHGDGSEGWMDVALRNPPGGWTARLCQQLAFSHGADWGHKRRGPGAPLSAGSIAQRASGGMHVWDILISAGSGHPTLSSGEYYWVTDQEFVPVTPVDHLGAATQPPTNRPAITRFFGVSAFDVAARVSMGDTAFYDRVLKATRLVGRVFTYATINYPGRAYRAFPLGLQQIDVLLRKLTADGLKAQFVMLCGTANDGTTRAQALDMIRQQNAVFTRYPNAVAGLQLFNEIPYVGLEADYATDPSFYDEAEALIDRRFPLAWGAGHGGAGVGMARGSYLVHHSNRDLQPDVAGEILGAAQVYAKRPVVDDEPRRIEAGGGGHSTGDLTFVRGLIAAAKRHNYSLTMHVAAGRGCNVSEIDAVQDEAITLTAAEVGSGAPVPVPILDVDMRVDHLWYPIFVTRSVELEVAIAGEYQRLTGRVPALTDIKHNLWRACVERQTWKTMRKAMSGLPPD